MDIKQLEFFLAVCDRGSINKAADCLYTTQPNVSRVIANFEGELGRSLFERTAKGMVLTPYGNAIRQYAEIILRHVKFISNAAVPVVPNKFSVATFRSDVISKLIADLYQSDNGDLFLEHYEGSVEEITDSVKNGISEIGMVYLSKKQMKLFNHILYHKKLKFECLGVRPVCAYVGPQSPLYKVPSVHYDELKNYRFIRGAKDFFSLDHHMDRISVGFADSALLQNAVYTNSDASIIELLANTDLCLLGVDTVEKKHEELGIRAVPITDSDIQLAVGYVYPEGYKIGKHAKNFIEAFMKTL